MKGKRFIRLGFWGGIGLIGGITAMLLVVFGVIVIIFAFAETKDSLGYNIKRLFSSQAENSLSDEWYIKSFELCEKDLLKSINSASYKRSSEVSTIGDNGYRKLLSWSFEIDNSITGSDMYSATCVVDKIKKTISLTHRII